MERNECTHAQWSAASPYSNSSDPRPETSDTHFHTGSSQVINNQDIPDRQVHRLTQRRQSPTRLLPSSSCLYQDDNYNQPPQNCLPLPFHLCVSAPGTGQFCWAGQPASTRLLLVVLPHPGFCLGAGGPTSCPPARMVNHQPSHLPILETDVFLHKPNKVLPLGLLCHHAYPLQDHFHQFPSPPPRLSLASSGMTPGSVKEEPGLYWTSKAFWESAAGFTFQFPHTVASSAFTSVGSHFLQLLAPTPTQLLQANL